MSKKKDGFEPNDDEAKVSLEDFVLAELVDAFCAAYSALPEWEEGCEVFTYTQLRNMFKAVPVTIGDPFIIYKQLLSQRGFYFHISTEYNEFVIYARAKV